MPYVKGKRYPYTDAGKKAAYKAANSVKQPITDVMSEIGGGQTSEPSLKKKSKLKPYKLKQGRV
jgi:hypothetical protein